MRYRHLAEALARIQLDPEELEQLRGPDVQLLPLNQAKAPAGQAAHKDVLCDRQVGGKLRVLVDAVDAEALRVLDVVNGR